MNWIDELWPHWNRNLIEFLNWIDSAPQDELQRWGQAIGTAVLAQEGAEPAESAGLRAQSLPPPQTSTTTSPSATTPTTATTPSEPSAPKKDKKSEKKFFSKKKWERERERERERETWRRCFHRFQGNLDSGSLIYKKGRYQTEFYPYTFFFFNINLWGLK